MRRVWLIARGVLIEAVRRKEIYAIVLATALTLGAALTMNFFNLQGLTKFYREIALKTMGIATALTVVVLASRQLPREFEARTIYPLMAKPITRSAFLLGKLVGVMLAGAFCFAMFMGVYLIGCAWLRHAVPWALFAQHIYLQMLGLLILATLSFWLSMMMNLDAAITIGVLYFLTSSAMTTAMSLVYDQMGEVAKVELTLLNFVIPHLTLFDLSEKAVHSSMWGPLDWTTMAELTAYGGFFAALYFGLAMFWFRRRPL